MATKVHDPEETRNEQAKRLTAKAVNAHTQSSSKLRTKIRRHAQHLSRHDRTSAIDYLRGDAELTIGLLEETGGELPEFGFPSDAVDEEWKLDG